MLKKAAYRILIPLCVFFTNSKATFASNEHNPTSLSDFLVQLNKEKPHLFKQQNVIYRSDSLQTSNPVFPRIINKDPFTPYFFTFNLDPFSEAYHELEIMEWNSMPDNLKNFSPQRYLKFSRKIFGADHKISTSDDNDLTQATCMRCHASPLKPIWKPYDFWQGSLGSMDDVIVDLDALQKPKKDEVLSSVLVNVGSSKKYFTEDLVVKTLKEEFSIYQYLSSMKTLSQVSVAQENLKRFSLIQFENIQDKPVYIPRPRSGTSKIRPNLKTTEELVALNTKRVFEMLKDTGSCYEEAKDVLLASLFECSTEYEIRPNIKILFDYLNKKYPTQNKYGYWSEAHKQSSSSTYSWASKERVIQAFTLFGIEKEDLNLEMNGEYWSFFDGEVDASAWVAREILKSKYSHWSDELKDSPYDGAYSFNWEHYVNNPNYCFELNKNLKNLASKLMENPDVEICKTPVVHTESIEENIPDVLVMCESCHNQGTNDAPIIDFRSEDTASIDSLQKKISHRINLPLERAGHMPPNRNLMRREKEALMEYLNRNKRSLKNVE